MVADVDSMKGPASVARWLEPQDYSTDQPYRRPSRAYGRLSRWIGVPLTSLGLAPRYAVTLEVAGRRTGRLRRNPVLLTRYRGGEYLVSLAGESEWVRNVRAAHGVAVLHRRGARAVRLVEVRADARAPVLAAYQAAGAARSGEAAARVQARFNFGLGPTPALSDFEHIAARYPVFRVLDRPRRYERSGRSPRHLVAEIGAVVADLPLFVGAPLMRRRHLRWGATPAEATAAMPGDELVPGAQYRTTRAITIDAPPEAVWPWLVQVGCQRGGFYSDDLLDNLGRPSARTILPQWQQLRIGQWVPMSPGTPDERTAFRVESFVEDESLLWTKPDSTWAWRLTPLPGGRTRLVTRVHALYDWSRPFDALLGVVLMELGDFAMMRRMLRGIKDRAESLAAS